MKRLGATDARSGSQLHQPLGEPYPLVGMFGDLSFSADGETTTCHGFSLFGKVAQHLVQRAGFTPQVLLPPVL